jgi:hypothetical protein
MKYTVGSGSGGISGIQKLIAGGFTDSREIAKAYFHFFFQNTESRTHNQCQ